MINIKFYQDTEGYFKADTDSLYLLLGQYFESEIQGVPEICQDLLTEIAQIERGDRTQLEGVGNAFGLKLTALNATIWNEFTATEQVLDLSLTDFKQALEECLVFLRSR
jgi:hypothetical protein